MRLNKNLLWSLFLSRSTRQESKDEKCKQYRYAKPSDKRFSITPGSDSLRKHLQVASFERGLAQDRSTNNADSIQGNETANEEKPSCKCNSGPSGSNNDNEQWAERDKNENCCRNHVHHLHPQLSGAPLTRSKSPAFSPAVM